MKKHFAPSVKKAVPMCIIPTKMCQLLMFYFFLFCSAQAMELGAAALEFLTGTWELHLTPSEAASVADNVSGVLNC